MIQLQMQAKQDLELVGISQMANHMREFAYKASTSYDTVLLMGETGTGKDHLAELIHHTGRKEKPFVTVDCGILTESLLEAELFGHTQGAFTDARSAKNGLIQVAEEGTLFLNEISNMSLSLQAKFLRILDKKSFRIVGGIKEISINTRIIVATNANLQQAVVEKSFREDLFHRLNVINFKIAPLRSRIEDIPVLARYFLDQNNSSKNFSDDAMKMLQQYNWPGNVRELQNLVKGISFFTSGDGDISVEDVFQIGMKEEKKEKNILQIGDESNFPTFPELRFVYLQEAIKKAKGNISKVSKITGIGRRTLFNEFKRTPVFWELVSSLRRKA